MKLFYLLLAVLLASCSTPQEIKAQTPQTKKQPSPNGKTFKDPADQIIYDSLAFESSFTESPEDCAAFDASCFVTDKQKYMLGSGSLIRSDVVLTAAHVAEAVSGGFVQFTPGGRMYPIDKIWLSPEWEISNRRIGDVALLRLGEHVKDVEPVRLAHGAAVLPRFGDGLFIVGSSLGYKKKSNPGIFYYYGTLNSTPDCLQLRSNFSTIWHGDSGGPVMFTDYDGHLYQVGVISAYSMYQDKLVDFTASDVRFYLPKIRGKLLDWTG